METKRASASAKSAKKRRAPKPLGWVYDPRPIGTPPGTLCKRLRRLALSTGYERGASTTRKSEGPFHRARRIEAWLVLPGFRKEDRVEALELALTHATGFYETSGFATIDLLLAEAQKILAYIYGRRARS